MHPRASPPNGAANKSSGDCAPDEITSLRWRRRGGGLDSERTERDATGAALRAARARWPAGATTTNRRCPTVLPLHRCSMYVRTSGHACQLERSPPFVRDVKAGVGEETHGGVRVASQDGFEGRATGGHVEQVQLVFGSREELGHHVGARRGHHVALRSVTQRWFRPHTHISSSWICLKPGASATQGPVPAGRKRSSSSGSGRLLPVRCRRVLPKRDIFMHGSSGESPSPPPVSTLTPPRRAPTQGFRLVGRMRFGPMLLISFSMASIAAW